MRKKRQKGLLWLLAIAIIALILYNVATPNLSIDREPTVLEQPIYVETLANGLQVTVKEVPTYPLVTIQFWIKVGSRNEPDGYQGIAHVFEHIWFKGTETQPVGSFHKRVEKLGGELNAMTFVDWTMYYVTVPSDKFDDIFPYMADLLVNPLFDENELQKEIEVVIEEQRSQFNTPEKYVDEKFTLQLIKKHPYRHPIIGYRDSIRRAPEKLLEFYNTYYVPNNMNVVIAGKVDKAMVSKIRDSLGYIPRQELPLTKFPTEIIPTTPEYNSTKRNLGSSYIAVGYFAPKATDKDRFAMEVLDSIMMEGESSRINRILKNEKQLITRAEGGYWKLIDMGVFEVVAVVDPKKSSQATAQLLLELNKFSYESVSEEELERAKKLIRANKLKNQEEVFDIGYSIGEAWIEGTLDELDDYLKNIDAVTKEDVKKVAQKYFKAHTMFEVKPK